MTNLQNPRTQPHRLRAALAVAVALVGGVLVEQAVIEAARAADSPQCDVVLIGYGVVFLVAYWIAPK